MASRSTGPRTRPGRPADVIAVGPGLGTAPGTVAFVHALLDRTGAPIVLDADALNAFTRRARPTDRAGGARRHHHPAPRRDGAPDGPSPTAVQPNRLERRGISRVAPCPSSSEGSSHGYRDA